MTNDARPIEDRRSHVECPRKGWIKLTMPSDRIDRPDMVGFYRVSEITDFGFAYSYEHPEIESVVFRTPRNGDVHIQNLPLSEFDAAMIEAESCNT